MLYAIVAVLAIILDQWLKFWVAGNIPLGTGVKELIPNMVSLVNLHNDGAAFGFLSGGNARIYFIILAGVFVLAVIIALATNFISGPVGRWSAVMVAAGGIANCIDRVIYGYVQDMFRFDFWPEFAIFNVADIFITVFAFVFILYIIFGGEKDDDYYEDDEEEYEDDEEYEEEAPARKSRRSEEEEPARKSARREEEPEEKPARKSRQAKYDEEFAQYKARRQAAAPAQTPDVKAAPAHNPADPFAEWERANKNQQQSPVQAQQPVQAVVYQPVVYQPVQPVVYQPVQPVQAYHPVQQPAQTAYKAPAQAPKKNPDDFDLEDILNEFKDF